jgi:hypothetical protein
LSPVCAGFKRDGSRCMVTVEPPQTHCWWHNPSNAERRKRAASKAGRSRSSGSKEIAALKTEIRNLIGDVLTGDAPQGRAAIAGQLYNCLLRALEQERRIKETEELEARIEGLERRYGLSRDGAAR